MNKKICYILNLWSCTNYGASLTCWGLQLVLEKLGYEAKIINYKPKIGLPYKESFAEKFASKYLNLSYPVNSYEDFVKLNNDGDIFIVGSDQVWNYKIMRSHHSLVSEFIYLLDFVKDDKKKISYAASFGTNTFILEKDFDFEKFNFYLKQFSDISIREDDGVSTVKDFFNIQATQLIDGAFHIPKDLLYDITNNYLSNDEYIGCYLLPYYEKEKWYKEFLVDLQSYTHLPLKFLKFDTSLSVENWLSFIRNSSMIVTDSYHATVFSIIFNKRFIQIQNSPMQSRFESLFRLFNFDDLSIKKNLQYDLAKLTSNPDWSTVNNNIMTEIARAEKWLRSAIERPKTHIDNNFSFNYFFAKNAIQIENNTKHIALLAKKNKIYRKYYCYGFLYTILPCSKRKTFYLKRKEYYHSLIRELRKI